MQAKTAMKEEKMAIKGLSALAYGKRLSVMRLLIKAGGEGLRAGQIARSLEVTPTTVSSQLAVLDNAGLVNSHRKRRSIVHTADCDALDELLVFLIGASCHRRADLSKLVLGVARARGEQLW